MIDHNGNDVPTHDNQPKEGFKEAVLTDVLSAPLSLLQSVLIWKTWAWYAVPIFHAPTVSFLSALAVTQVAFHLFTDWDKVSTQTAKKRLSKNWAAGISAAVLLLTAYVCRP